MAHEHITNLYIICTCVLNDYVLVLNVVGYAYIHLIHIHLVSHALYIHTCTIKHTVDLLTLLWLCNELCMWCYIGCSGAVSVLVEGFPVGLTTSRKVVSCGQSTINHLQWTTLILIEMNLRKPSNHIYM